MSAFIIDAFEFCKSDGFREGSTPLVEMTRLAEESSEKGGDIRWTMQGGQTRHGYPSLTLEVAGHVKLECQRCLQPMDYDIDSSTMLVLGKDDEEADAIEIVLDDDSIDVIVGSRTCDIRQLLEDEALLALPQSPKHDVCPETKLLDSLKNQKPSPFAGLKNLKAE